MDVAICVSGCDAQCSKMSPKSPMLFITVLLVVPYPSPSAPTLVSMLLTSCPLLFGFIFLLKLLLFNSLRQLMFTFSLSDLIDLMCQILME